MSALKRTFDVHLNVSICCQDKLSFMDFLIQVKINAYFGGTLSFGAGVVVLVVHPRSPV